MEGINLLSARCSCLGVLLEGLISGMCAGGWFAIMLAGIVAVFSYI